MRWVTSHQGRLQVRGDEAVAGGRPVVDLWGGSIPARSVHEFLFHPALGHPAPMFPTLVLARGIARTLVWCDPDGVLYPPAVQLGGVPVERVCLLRPKRADVVWAVGECLQ